ncbi:Pol polyprotein, partial [Dorcoceras hygrometricum]
YTYDRRVRLVIHQLHGLGKSWWIATKKAFENQGTVITWSVFKTAFYQRFFPVSYRKDKGAEFANLRQGQVNIEEYVAKFTSLLKFAPHVAVSDEAQADQFINGLNPDVFTLVSTGRPNTFADALNRAKGAEAGLVRQQEAQFVPLSVRSSQEKPQIPPPPRFDAGGSSSGKNNFSKGKGKQFKRSCTGSSYSLSESKQLRAGQKSDFYCTKCGGRHITEQCRRVLAFAVSAINPDTLREYAPNLVLEVHRILEHRHQCHHRKGKHLLCIHSNHRFSIRVDKEGARQ